MRKPVEITRPYQFWYMIKRYLAGVTISAVVEFLLFLGSYSNDIFRAVSGVLFSAFGFLIVYDSSALLAKYDMKSYTPLKYDLKYAPFWGIAISLINLAWFAVFKMNWYFGASDGALSNPVSVFVNILFYIWNAPYMAFIIVSPKTIPWIVAAVSVVSPIAASILGYISGKNDFAISDKLRNLMFEKEK